MIRSEGEGTQGLLQNIECKAKLQSDALRSTLKLNFFRFQFVQISTQFTKIRHLNWSI